MTRGFFLGLAAPKQAGPDATEKHPGSHPCEHPIDQEEFIRSSRPKPNLEPPQSKRRKTHQEPRSDMEPIVSGNRRLWCRPSTQIPAYPQANGCTPAPSTHGHRCTEEFVCFERRRTDIRAQNTVCSPAERHKKRNPAGNTQCGSWWPQKKNCQHRKVRPCRPVRCCTCCADWLCRVRKHIIGSLF